MVLQCCFYLTICRAEDVGGLRWLAGRGAAKEITNEQEKLPKEEGSGKQKAVSTGGVQAALCLIKCESNV